MIKLRNLETVKARREALERELRVSLKNIGYYSLDEEVASTRNCENMIGVCQVPLGIAGPLRLCSGQACKNYYLPLATTEGALVASISRGCKAISESGGANVLVEKVGMTRGPVFKTKSLKDSFKLNNWLISHFNDLDDLSKQTSSHLKLLKIEPQVLGRNVYVRFYFEAGQAMGMNMVTLATQAMVPLIEKETKSKCLSLSANFCVDKKSSWLNFLKGRGRKVWAEAVIKNKIIKEVLKTTPEKIYEVWLNKCLLGSAISGSMGFNAHFANIIAAIFAATGQDLAHISEGSLGITTIEKVKSQSSKVKTREEDLYISVYLPGLPIGVVGGGTGLVTQKEALSIIFGLGKAEVNELASLIGGAVLAGEISLLASLAEGSLAQAHLRLARGGYGA